jgi:hypothetical protein
MTKIQNEKKKVEKSSISNDTTKAQDTLNHVLEHMAQMSIESQELKKVLIWMKIISSKLKV